MKQTVNFKQCLRRSFICCNSLCAAWFADRSAANHYRPTQRDRARLIRQALADAHNEGHHQLRPVAQRQTITLTSGELS